VLRGIQTPLSWPSKKQPQCLAQTVLAAHECWLTSFYPWLRKRFEICLYWWWEGWTGSARRHTLLRTEGDCGDPSATSQIRPSGRLFPTKDYRNWGNIRIILQGSPPRSSRNLRGVREFTASHHATSGIAAVEWNNESFYCQNIWKIYLVNRKLGNWSILQVIFLWVIQIFNTWWWNSLFYIIFKFSIAIQSWSLK